MALLWTDGTWTSESQVSGYRFSYPIDGVTSARVCEADYVVQRSSYSVPTLGASSTINSTTFYHVGDGPQTDLRGGMVKFTRKWATAASDHNEYETFPYNFIGLSGVWGATTEPTGRNRFTKIVVSRIANKYYVITGNPADTGPLKYETPADIPVLTEQQYYFGSADYPTNWLADSPPWSSATTPSKTTYLGWTAAGTEIVAEPSSVRRWMGPLYVRSTRYVVAE